MVNSDPTNVHNFYSDTYTPLCHLKGTTHLQLAQESSSAQRLAFPLYFYKLQTAPAYKLLRADRGQGTSEDSPALLRHVINGHFCYKIHVIFDVILQRQAMRLEAGEIRLHLLPWLLVVIYSPQWIKAGALKFVLLLLVKPFVEIFSPHCGYAYYYN